MERMFRQELRGGERLFGSMITLDSPATVEIMAQVGFDWLFIDGEHSPLPASTMQSLLQAAAPTPCLIRLASTNEVDVKKALDIGAAGIIAPMVNNAEIAQAVVRWAKYAPLGTRGVGLGRAHGYGLKFQEYLAQANDETAVVIQVEHIEAVENMESIVQVAGVDAILVGPYDLSASLGRIGEVDHPLVVRAIERVTQTCQAAGVALGIFGVSADAVRPYIERGYTLIIAGVDTLLMGQAARNLLADLRADA